MSPLASKRRESAACLRGAINGHRQRLNSSASGTGRPQLPAGQVTGGAVVLFPRHMQGLAVGRSEPEPLFRSDVITFGALKASTDPVAGRNADYQVPFV